jgi:PAS domain S-box-containing protein
MFLILEAIYEPIVVGDEDGLIVFMNQSSKSLFNVTEDITGQLLQVLMPVRYRALHEAAMKRLKQGGTPTLMGKRLQVEGLKVDGTEFPVELRLGCFSQDEKKYYVAFFKDFSGKILVSKGELEKLW